MLTSSCGTASGATVTGDVLLEMQLIPAPTAESSWYVL